MVNTSVSRALVYSWRGTAGYCLQARRTCVVNTSASRALVYIGWLSGRNGDNRGIGYLLQKIVSMTKTIGLVVCPFLTMYCTGPFRLTWNIAGKKRNSKSYYRLNHTLCVRPAYLTQKHLCGHY